MVQSQVSVFASRDETRGATLRGVFIPSRIGVCLRYKSEFQHRYFQEVAVCLRSMSVSVRVKKQGGGVQVVREFYLTFRDWKFSLRVRK